jgi:dimethylaniline monooxygenase (N-oxide forming)
VTIVRDNVDAARKGSVLLRSGQEVKCDHVLNATGWGGHFNFLSPELKEELGIPMYGAAASTETDETDEKGDFWEPHDRAAEEVVAKSLPLLATGPQNVKPKPHRMITKRRWRLYNRCVPLSSARKGDHSLVILGQIHTTQTPTIAGIQSL